jgi:Carboxypeptidase regulatory-like domain
LCHSGNLPTGIVLPGVEIRAAQTATDITRTTVTNETASFVLSNLPIGPYKLEASLPGFRTYAQTGIVLQADSNPVINVILRVGQVAETIEIQANAALVETRSTSVGQVVENTRILELPLNGRQVVESIGLAGAAAPARLRTPRPGILLTRWPFQLPVV